VEGADVREEEIVPEEEDDMWPPHVSERARRQDTLSGFSLAGPWASSGAGPIWSPPRPVFLFFVLFFSFSCFTISLITFAIKLQMNSNQLLKFSKIHSNILCQ
jgi:hypothetical protein